MKTWWRRIRKLLKWIVLTVIALCFLNLGEMLQIHWPSWLQWGIKLPFQVKIEQQGKADMQKHTTLAPTVSSKVSVTEKITISPISTKTPEPINKMEEFPLDIWVPKYTKEPINTPIPVPTIEPTPRVSLSIQTIYLLQEELKIIISGETVKIDSWEIKRNKENIEVQGSLYTLFSQIEETGTEKVLLKWYIDQNSYHLKAIFRKKNLFLDWLSSLGRERSIIIQ